MHEQYPFTSLPSLDEEVIRPLKELLGDNFANFVSEFIASFPPKLHDLKIASHCDDVDTILQISHTLKSSSGSFGFIRLFRRLEYLELQARQNNLIDQQGQVDLIDQEFQYICSRLDDN